MGPAEQLTTEIYQDIQLDLHALLGMVTVLNDGESNNWWVRAKDASKYVERFKGAVKSSEHNHYGFKLLLGSLRNYAQHFSDIPFTVSQITEKSGAATLPFIELDARKMQSNKKLHPDLKEYFFGSEKNLDLVYILKDAYRGFEALDTFNRELLLELFTDNLEAVEIVGGLSSPEPEEIARLINTDKSGTEQQIADLLTPSDIKLLKALAGLPNFHPIFFPRPHEPGRFLQGTPIPTSRPHLTKSDWPLNSDGIADWASDIDGARRGKYQI